LKKKWWGNRSFQVESKKEKGDRKQKKKKRLSTHKKIGGKRDRVWGGKKKTVMKSTLQRTYSKRG